MSASRAGRSGKVGAERNAETWQLLQEGVDQILHRLREGVNMKTYMKLYTAVHDFCTSARGVNHSSTMGSTQARGAHLLGEELYLNLSKHLDEHCNKVLEGSQGYSGDALLAYYNREYSRYTNAATYNNHIFTYLNRHWVKREVDEGKKTIYDIYTLHLVRWRDSMLMKIQDELIEALLALIERKRNGETVDKDQIKNIIDSYCNLGIDENDGQKGTMELYRKYFESPFLDATREYYQKESNEFLANNSVVEYMKKAQQRLLEEKEDVPLYFINDIELPLRRTCDTALIFDHADKLRDEFQSLLDNDRIEDLARMYKLLQRIEDGLDPLRSKFERHVVAEGKAAVTRVATEGDSLEPKSYVDALLSTHTQFAQLVENAFTNEAEFIRSLDSACREFINHNDVCEKATQRSPELLAKYTDSLLKNNGKMTEENQIGPLLDQVMVIFKYIDDKDVFQKFYQRMLARRLVQYSSTSDDAETSMIGKLKDVCGFEYTNKLQRMYQDTQTSKDLNRDYKAWLDAHETTLKKSSLDAHFSILGTGFWPLNAPTTPFTEPSDIRTECDRFDTFYKDKHSGRKLTWLWQLCKGEMRINYCKSPSRIPYTLQVSTFQMAILLQWNTTSADVISYDDIAAATSLNKETLDPSIGIMIKARVLLTVPEDAKVESGTSFKLNMNFKNKKVKINLNIGIKSEQKAETEETHKTIEEDRKLVIQSAIVRIMKSRKQMRHQLLIQEAIAQVTSRFKPTVPDIKKCIDILLEKEYLERLDGEELGYLA